MSNNVNDKILLTVPEIMEYTGFGEKKVRSILNNPKSTYTIRNGKKLYAHKKRFEEYLDRCAKFGLTL